MKTIFITSLNPFVTRNILFTEVFSVLKSRPDIRLVIFCPDYKVDYFKKNFAAENVFIEGIKPQVISLQDVVFRYLGGSLIDNRTRYIHQRRELLHDKNYFKFWFSRLLSKLSRLVFIKKLVRVLDYLTISKKKFARFFDVYKPALVFGPDIYHDDDVHFMAEAKWRGIRTVGMVRSWDNITNKGFCRVKPDKLIVNNELIKAEAIEYCGIDPDNVFVAGMPQFDYYIKAPFSNREKFFTSLGFDPKKRLIMFSPHGNRFHDTDWHIMQILKEARMSGEIPENVQILVRFPPNDDVSLGDFVPDEYFHIDRPGKVFVEGVYRDKELDWDEMRHLADSLYYSELVITYNSSIIIDAAAFGKPAVGIAFDGWDKKPDIYRSIARFMEYDHTQHVIKTGGLQVVRKREELIEAVNAYLANPKLNQDGIRKILETQAWKYDGQAGARIANFIYAQIESAS